MTYAARRRRNLAALSPAVRALVAAGVLHPFDAEWIGGLPPERQLAAAEKCVGGTPIVCSVGWQDQCRSKIWTSSRASHAAG